jgi:hypothetical protein
MKGWGKRLILVGVVLAAPAAWSAPPTLPYSSRTRPYNAANTTVHGDLRTIGLAGATVGLADSFIASYDNPAGLAMTLSGGGLLFSGNTFTDGHIQDPTQNLTTYDLGAYSSEYPWGWGLGFSNQYTEGAKYVLPTTGETALMEVFTREIRISAARVLFDHRVSIGLSLILAQAAREIEFEPDPTTGVRSPGLGSYSYSMGAQLGLLFQLPKRWLIGISATTPVSFENDLANNPSVMPGFNQHVIVPWKLNVGVGWIPSRFMRFGAGLYFLGLSPNAALISNQNTAVGLGATMQPRVGAFYRLVEFKEVVMEIATGSYLEFPRIAGHGPRLHWTGGAEIKPWIFNVGVALDLGENYQNYLLSIGVDIGKVLQKLDLIPTEWHPPYAGFFPNPLRYHDEGLPPPINPTWRRHGPGTNVLQIGRELPGRVKDKLQELGEDIREAGQDTLDAISGETESDVADQKRKAADETRKDEAKKAEKKKPRSTAPNKKKEPSSPSKNPAKNPPKKKKANR